MLKKIVSLCVIMALVFSMTVTAFATDVGAGAKNEITATDRDSLKVENEEAEKVYREFLSVVSFIETDRTWTQGEYALLNWYRKSDTDIKLYGQWYADNVQGGSLNDYVAMTPFEQFLWTETYTRLANCMNDGWGYDHYFANKNVFSAKITRIIERRMTGNNADVVKDAYNKLMDWQYEYITENGVPFNFIRNRSYIDEMQKDPETPGQSPDEQPPADTPEPPAGDNDTTVEPDVDVDTKQPEEKGLWGETMEVLAKNSLTILLLLVLGGAVAVLVHKRKSKNMDDI